jgi:hypothetical protein
MMFIEKSDFPDQLFERMVAVYQMSATSLNSFVIAAVEKEVSRLEHVKRCQPRQKKAPGRPTKPMHEKMRTQIENFFMKRLHGDSKKFREIFGVEVEDLPIFSEESLMILFEKLPRTMGRPRRNATEKEFEETVNDIEATYQSLETDHGKDEFLRLYGHQYTLWRDAVMRRDFKTVSWWKENCPWQKKNPADFETLHGTLTSKLSE